MCNDNCTHTTDTRVLKKLVKEAESAAACACEAAKVAEASACRAASLAKAAEEAACQAERSANAAREAACCAEEIAARVRHMVEDMLEFDSGCGCELCRKTYPCTPHHDC